MSSSRDLVRKRKQQAFRRLSQSKRKPMLSPAKLQSNDENPFLTALASKTSIAQLDEEPQQEEVIIAAAPSPVFSPVKKKQIMFSYADAVRGSSSKDQSHDIRSHDPKQSAEPLPGASNKSLHIKGVPEDLNNEDHLLNHFSRFGSVEAVQCDRRKRCADVHFKTREGAVSAKKLGRALSTQYPPVSIFWFSKKLPIFSNEKTVNIKRKEKRATEEDKDPDYQYGLEHQSETDEEDEGVDEGVDSVLVDRPKDDDDAMDTIARTVNHPYYLRSLHQPELDTPTDDTSSYERYGIPVLSLQAPPPPAGLSAFEHFEALDSRDKEIRKSVIKDTSLKAQAVIGSCPDMCPEKERYERDYQRRLSVFEVLPEGGVDHSKAIKEYSRSAADKDEPLSHELRPLPVLLMTMDYICTCIIDKLGEHPDWYHFVWDRTRAITTDMTYQQLCDPQCALIIERCARFHILSAYMLCEDEVKTFDPKMNHESLARHLQSLRQLYNDLKTDKEVVITNEPEMCCYDILLHVGDGNVLNKIEGYSQSVRQSKEVMFAISVVQAMESNNFVRFFKLIRKADFLTACILHRYFNQIRRKALSVLNTSHSPGVGKTMHFNLTDLSRMLGFSNREKAASFCHDAGIHVSREKVQLQRGLEVCPPNSGNPVREDDVILVKINKKTFSEAVYGGPLPPKPNHTPCCSFTGTPNQKAIKANYYNEEELLEVLDILIDEVLSDEFDPVVLSVVSEAETCHVQECVAQDLQEEIVSDVVGVASKEISQRVLIEELNMRDKQETEEIMQVVVSDNADGTLEEVVISLCSEVIRETLTEAKLFEEELHQSCVEEMTNIIDNVSGECVKGIILEAIQSVKDERKKQLILLENTMRLRRLRTLWDRWMEVLRRQQRIYHSISQFPPTGPLVALNGQLKNMVTLATPPHLIFHRDPFVSSDNWLEGYKEKRDQKLQPVDISSILLTHLSLPSNASSAKDKITIFWNLVVLASEKDLLSDERVACLWLWLKGKLETTSQQDKSHDLSKPSFFSPRVSVKFCSTDTLPQPGGVPLETSALLLLVRMPLDCQGPESYADHVISTLPSRAEIPLFILTPYKLPLAYEVHLIRVMETCQLNSVAIATLGFSNDQLVESLGWLANNTRVESVVEWMDLYQYMYQGISSGFYRHLIPEIHSSVLNERPNVIIEFFNEVLMSLIKQIEIGVVTVSPSHELHKIKLSSWKPPQCNIDDIIKKVKQALYLPNLNVSEESDWSTLCMAYVNSITNDVTIKSRVKALVYLSGLNSTPWAQILFIIVEHVLESCKLHDQFQIGVPLGHVNHTSLPLRWIETLAESSEISASRKRRLSEPSNLCVPLKSRSRLSMDSLDTRPLSLAVNEESFLQAEFEKQLNSWLECPPNEDSDTSRITDHTKGNLWANDDSELPLNSVLKNERWKEKVAYMKLKALETSHLKDIGKQ